MIVPYTIILYIPMSYRILPTQTLQPDRIYRVTITILQFPSHFEWNEVGFFL